MRLLVSQALGALVSAVSSCAASPRPSSSLYTHAWQEVTSHDAQPFDVWCPECSLPEVAKRPARALCISGGGTRTYTAAVGEFRALADANLLQEFRYIMAVSGGGWFLASLAYDQTGATVKELLGNMTEPEDLTLEGLKADIPKSNMLQSATNHLLENLFLLLGESKLGYEDSVDIFSDSLYKSFLENRNIEKEALFSWSEETVKDIRARNPTSLADQKFVSVAEGFPFLVFGMSVIGPSKLVPLDLSTKFSVLEATPLYIGQEHTGNYTFGKHDPESLVVGGLIEPFAFGSSAPATRLPEGKRDGYLVEAEPPKSFFVLKDMIAAVSWAPSALFAQFAPSIERYLYKAVNYWSPVSSASGTPATPLILGDGGIIDNNHVIGALKRRMPEIVLLLNTEVPLQGTWNASRDKFTGSEIDPTIAAYFGVRTPSVLVHYESLHVFPKEYFAAFAAGLQESQALGDGTVVRMTLPVLANNEIGVVGGWTTTLTCVYMTRAINWEKSLPEKLRRLVVPKFHPDRAWSLKRLGPLRGFPHISVTRLTISPMVANLMASLTSWVIRKNAHLIVPPEARRHEPCVKMGPWGCVF